MMTALAPCGIGFGISNGFICQRTIATSATAERDVTSGAIPTFEGLGAALGAAFAGIIATSTGFPDLDPSTRPMVWAFLIGGLLGLPAIARRHPVRPANLGRAPGAAARGVDCPVTSVLLSHAHSAPVHAGLRPIGRA